MGSWGAEPLTRAIELVAFHPALTLLWALLLFVVGRALAAILSEYVKLWWFKGIPPWRAHSVLLANIDELDKSLRARERELEAHRATINAALARAEEIEVAYLAQKVRIAELERRLGEQSGLTSKFKFLHFICRLIWLAGNSIRSKTFDPSEK